MPSIISKSLNCHSEGDEDEDEEDEEDEGEDEEEPGLDYLQKENLEVNVTWWAQRAVTIWWHQSPCSVRHKFNGNSFPFWQAVAQGYKPKVLFVFLQRVVL